MRAAPRRHRSSFVSVAKGNSRGGSPGESSTRVRAFQKRKVCRTDRGSLCDPSRRLRSSSEATRPENRGDWGLSGSALRRQVSGWETVDSERPSPPRGRETPGTSCCDRPRVTGRGSCIQNSRSQYRKSTQSQGPQSRGYSHGWSENSPRESPVARKPTRKTSSRRPRS
jgi:hypothetical protein